MNQNISSPHTRQNALHTHMKPRQVDFRKYLHERDQDREHHDHVATVVVAVERERAQKKVTEKVICTMIPLSNPKKNAEQKQKQPYVVVVSPHHHVVSSLPKSYKLAARIGVRFRSVSQPRFEFRIAM
jgi:siroheme synthase (precorrin-2 oxidase/ferrochelatase)